MKIWELFKPKLRNISKMQSHNDGTRTLLESVLAPEVMAAVKDWISTTKGINCVLIGGLALSYYGKPRYTSDGDFLFLSEAEIPSQVSGFKRNRAHAFEHKKTGVEIEVLTPQTINLNPNLVQAIFNTAVRHDGILIASPSGLVATKLGRFNLQDRADIMVLYNLHNIDISQFPLDTSLIERYNKLIQDESTGHV